MTKIANRKAAPFDFAVVGAGIVGLACAYAAARRGARVAVFDRDFAARGASVRNFGLILITGLGGDDWIRARRARNIWEKLSAAAGIKISHRGLVVTARLEETLAVLESFALTEAGGECEMLSPSQARKRSPGLRADGLRGALWSPNELRVESREAIPRLTRFLADRFGVQFFWRVAVHSANPPRLETSVGKFAASRCAICPGGDSVTLFADRLASYKLQFCKLQMLRLRPARKNFQIGAAVINDLSVGRYEGFRKIPAHRALLSRLKKEKSDALTHGVHLVAAQSADGSLTVGDSHEYGQNPPDPFAPVAAENLILREFNETFNAPAEVCERWLGWYPYLPDRSLLIDRPDKAVRVVMVTAGIGASIAFAVGEEIADELM